MEKMDFRTLSSEERYRFRKRAIALIKSGKKQKDISNLFGVRANTISSWNKSYKLLGIKGLRAKPKGPSPEKVKLLTTEQEIEIQKMIIDTMPDQLKLSFSLWTRKAVKELVERELSIVLAINTMGDYLRSWGFTPQNQRKKPLNNVLKRYRDGLKKNIQL
jgi:transposase